MKRRENLKYPAIFPRCSQKDFLRSRGRVSKSGPYVLHLPTGKLLLLTYASNWGLLPTLVLLLPHTTRWAHPRSLHLQYSIPATEVRTEAIKETDKRRIPEYFSAGTKDSPYLNL
ncbi:uncharacterized protein BO96DRAFT_230629 [Aspergillus niger CBS 101883]|uniref:uncharacterized protein n=1 Tax=Aspergillus lacticoffeatus (strain CBS 101883) TaxID=1450533 RepID=UPI000D801F92|nr:uncharacterized protein BO96DRAFT_230629 [Aspergillus niger CBS 101883]PYH58964.1 hypothetical protein BO96DRAFT_230629 [Aspergillus niger CBS 101883]